MLAKNATLFHRVYLAIGICFIPYFFVEEYIFSEWLYRALIFLVISCPCALVISVPLGYFGGIGGAARKGILVKGGQYLEILKQAKTIVFDKTGTLTKGNFTVNEIEVLGGFTKEEMPAMEEEFDDDIPFQQLGSGASWRAI